MGGNEKPLRRDPQRCRPRRATAPLVAARAMNTAVGHVQPRNQFPQRQRRQTRVSSSRFQGQRDGVERHGSGRWRRRRWDRCRRQRLVGAVALTVGIRGDEPIMIRGAWGEPTKPDLHPLHRIAGPVAGGGRCRPVSGRRPVLEVVGGFRSAGPYAPGERGGRLCHRGRWPSRHHRGHVGDDATEMASGSVNEPHVPVGPLGDRPWVGCGGDPCADLGYLSGWGDPAHASVVRLSKPHVPVWAHGQGRDL